MNRFPSLLRHIHTGAVVFICLAICYVFLNSRSHSSNTPIISDTVRIESGRVAGLFNPSTGVVAFKGIPYAAPPVGELRWKAPQPPSPWQEVRTCFSFAPSPIQLKPFPFLMLTRDFLVPEKPMSEDCLYLNVWTSTRKPGDRKPVLVWIYGGGFNTGGAAAPGYDGEQMAKKGCVFVSFNYRLGIFGFFAHPDLSRESKGQGAGNFGLLDQVAVLRWIHANIAQFGGDPDNITIAGQSAGSMSVYCLLASPLARGLVHRAIAESGVPVLSNGFFAIPDLASAEKSGLSVAATLKANSIDSLRKIPAERLFYRTLGFYGPIFDGYVLPRSVFREGLPTNPSHISLLTGWNKDEGLVFHFRSSEEFVRQIRQEYGDHADMLLQFYPAAGDSQAAKSQLALSRDRLIAAPQYRLASTWSREGDSIFLYEFTKVPPSVSGEPDQYGAFHTAEISYALHNLGIVRRRWQKSDSALEDLLSSYWLNFATNGNPNGKGLPQWPRYSDEENKLMVLGDSTYATPVPNREVLNLLLSRAEK